MSDYVDVESFVRQLNSGSLSMILFVFFIVSGLIFDIYQKYSFKRSEITFDHLYSNIFSIAIGSVVNFWAFGLFLFIFHWVYLNFRVLEIEFSIIEMIFAFVLLDFCHYLQHRMEHRTGLLWALHSVHHSCPEMHATAGPRSMWGIVLIQPAYLLLPIIGFNVQHFLFTSTLSNIWGIFTHVRAMPRLRAIERHIITPASHHVHHANQVQYLDKNYGQVFAWFDRMFGTFEPLVEEPRFGLVDEMDEKNPFRFQIAGVRDLWRKMVSAERLADKVRYLFKPPGWAHQGVQRTTAALRAAAAGERTGTYASRPNPRA